MKSWNGVMVSRALGIAAPADLTFTSITTDTRSLVPGALFVALEGERFDGHAFLSGAADNGAIGAVVRRGTPGVDGLTLFEVDDTVDALGLLARERRRWIEGPVVAVTGTNGKTSTKEMLRCVLSERWIVHATHQNLNNLIGVPLTILNAPDDCDALVIEAGANEPGEIPRLRDVIEPSMAIVTNVGAGHLEGFGSVEGVLREKTSLLSGVPVGVVGMDPPDLAVCAARLADRVVTAGLADPAAVHPSEWGIGEAGSGWFVREGTRVALPVLGKHQLVNAMLAVAVGVELGIGMERIGARLGEVRLPAGRCEAVQFGEGLLLHDAYNANPESLTALLETAAIARGKRRLVVVLGTMLELGHQSDILHARMADAVLSAAPDLVAVTGEFISAFERHRGRLADRLVTAPDAESLGVALKGLLDGGEIVLLKGSHGVHMERAIPYIMASYSTDEEPCSTIS